MQVIQRRCGERTQDKYLSSYQGCEALATVEGTDLFSVTLQSLEVASKSTCEWSAFIDADVRLYDGALDQIKEVLKDIPETVYQVGFPYDDKFLGLPAFGMHIHRNIYTRDSSLWFKAYAMKGPEAESKNIKSFILDRGLRSMKVDLVVGSHDYGQYYRDIFLKFIIRGVRHKKRLNTYIDQVKSVNNDDDIDCMIAIAGLRQSALFPNDLNCARNISEAEVLWSRYDVVEKLPMDSIKDELDNKKLRHSDVFKFPKLVMT